MFGGVGAVQKEIFTTNQHKPHELLAHILSLFVWFVVKFLLIGQPQLHRSQTSL
jgi:hypothetical protein